MTREERELIATVRKWARANGWDLHHWRGWINAAYDSDATLTVGYDSNPDDAAILIWRKGTAGLFPVRSTDYPVTSVRQAVDVLCALDVLPGELSSTYWAGVESVEEWLPLPMAPYAEYLRQFATPEAAHA